MDEEIGQQATAGPLERDESAKVLTMQRDGWIQEIRQKQKGQESEMEQTVAVGRKSQE